jgi:hypothetical protein
MTACLRHTRESLQMTCVHYAIIASSAIIEASHSVLLLHSNMPIILTINRWQQSHRLLQDRK